MKAKPAVPVFAALILLLLGNMAWAQGGTVFGMIGITRSETLLFNVVAFPPEPIDSGSCGAVLGFQDSQGNAIGPTLQAGLSQGQSVSLALKGNTLTKTAGARVEVLPVFQGTSAACQASVEVVQNGSAITAAAAPGLTSFPPNPIFPMVGITSAQTARLNVVAAAGGLCIATLSFANNSGTTVGTPQNVLLNAGQAAYLDLPGTELVGEIHERADIHPVVTLSDQAPPACIGSEELYNTATGETTVYFPPVPI